MQFLLWKNIKLKSHIVLIGYKIRVCPTYHLCYTTYINFLLMMWFSYYLMLLCKFWTFSFWNAHITMLIISRSSFNDKPKNHFCDIQHHCAFWWLFLPRDLVHGLHNSSTTPVSVNVTPFARSGIEHGIN